jgi:hypothetical protein
MTPVTPRHVAVKYTLMAMVLTTALISRLDHIAIIVSSASRRSIVMNITAPPQN